MRPINTNKPSAAIRVIDYTCTSAAGIDIPTQRGAIEARKSGLRRNDLPGQKLDTWIGRVGECDAATDLGSWQSRNNALAAVGLGQGTLLSGITKLITRFGEQRIGIVIGSSTSSIDRTESAYADLDSDSHLKPEYRQPLVHNPHGPGLFAAHFTGISGPAMTINTACSSSAKVFATGARWLRAGIVDAVLIGGVDSLCHTVLQGFDSLQLISTTQCRPFDQDRDGINLGEAAAFAILMRESDCDDDSGAILAGYGESSDAHHMSHPHPEGLGARLAIEQALAMANLAPSDIDYINLHGTASRANDLIEGKLMASMFQNNTLCSSSKAWTGHTLGAAGIVEALIALDTFATGLAPGSLNLEHLDEALDFPIQKDNQEVSPTNVMSNSFGFGGNNCCLIFSKIAA